MSEDVRIKEAHEILTQLKQALASVILGQETVIDLLLSAFLVRGHVLLEGVPGVAKTSLAKALAQATGLQFKRIQLTPDMMPTEITGCNLYDFNSRTFHFQRGPIFTDILLGDELNRTPPKTQAALLEAMEEAQVTIDGTSYPLSQDFMVVATLNPIEFEGTYPLPESQLDRFFFKIQMGYPESESEKAMLLSVVSPEGGTGKRPELSPLIMKEGLDACRAAVNQVFVSPEVVDYVLNLVQASREHPYLELGCSPRGAMAWLSASRAYAVLQGQSFVTPDHIKLVAKPLLAHRLKLTSRAELDDLSLDHVIRQLLSKVAVPR